MSFRARLTLAAAAAVAIAIALASGLVYVLVRDQLRGEVESTLEERASLLASGPLSVRRGPNGSQVLETPYRGLAQGDVFVQAVDAQGTVAKPDPRQVAFPVTEEVTRAAAEGGDPFFADAVIEGTHVLQLVVPVGDGYALQLIRPLEEVDRLLDRIGLVLILVSLVGIAAAAAIGALVARTALRPVEQLTREAEVVAETRDLSHRIGLEGNDELEHVRVLDHGIGEERIAALGGGLLDLVRHGERDLLRIGGGDAAIGVDRLDEDVALLEAAVRRVEHARPVRPAPDGERPRGQERRTVLERRLDLAAELVADEDVDEAGRERDRDCDGGRGGEGEPCAEAHDSRNA